jgi:homoserine dehydrogenase
MAPREAVNIGLIGVGTVGSGVARILAEKRDVYARQLGAPLNLKAALVRDLGKERPGLPAAHRELLTVDPGDVLDDPDIDIVVEVWVGEHPALEFISRALEAGKYVVTANKEVMAKHGSHLLTLAHDRGVDLLFEASVGGGIPIIAPLKRDLLANSIISLSAIINGTTNYILTAMSRHGTDFGEALRAAQELGYAEADPTNDIEAEDARYKLAILASLAFRGQIRVEDIHREGITRLTARDFRYAQELGYAIKLLALARQEATGVQARVHPAFVPLDEPLAKVDGVLNAVQIEGDLSGKVLFQGRGAGSLPTTSAVIADVLDAGQSLIGGRRQVNARNESLTAIVPMAELRTRYYLRLTVADQPGVLAQISHILGEGGISISSVIQKEAHEDAQTAELVIMTHVAREASMQKAMTQLSGLDVVQEIGNFLRVEQQ